jgi:hypothetical protein
MPEDVTVWPLTLSPLPNDAIMPREGGWRFRPSSRRCEDDVLRRKHGRLLARWLYGHLAHRRRTGAAAGYGLARAGGKPGAVRGDAVSNASSARSATTAGIMSGDEP